MIRRARVSDIERLDHILFQVQDVHANGRPDIFIKGAKKYNDEQLTAIINDDQRPIFVYTDDNDIVLGYAFCIYEYVENNSMHKMKTLYIDDLCVDENYRRRHIATDLYHYVLQEASNNDCYRVTLNVWCLNGSAMKFYEKMGMNKLKIVMEQIV